MGLGEELVRHLFFFLKTKPLYCVCVRVCIVSRLSLTCFLVSAMFIFCLSLNPHSSAVINDEKYAKQSMVEMVLLTSLQIRKLYCFLTKEVSDYNQEIAQSHTADQSTAP